MGALVSSLFAWDPVDASHTRWPTASGYHCSRHRASPPPTCSDRSARTRLF
ncbi:hypothetical protein PF005_g26172 [Phytophthora fragariae]|uniref:Uncharacterized protein n=2 Tax=Phytophthora TaxID=4783 RepID=A0A6A3DSE2_9STRA|nr:hypothetical protein PF003_g38073 [Phytophthora fragariae]KAE8986143.1 hypothetical protein PR001_g22678 [Phytophthora rubi]KAE8923955.1 hypothetical protein PF009_g25804 [Phytophthora fragariae]KAE8973922.1 hypothetical protein PF011_g25061 [Phytophthora fragariae]KAE9030878.1 hypothetical protein PR002_g9786 [Phytophthora rubi]